MRAIDVRDLLGRPGSARSIRLEEPVDGLRIGMAGVPEGTPVTVELTLESVLEGIFVTGRLRGRIDLSCARCLKEFDREFEVEVNEVFSRAQDGDDDAYALDPEGLDPEPMIRDAVALSLPFSPLCRPDCRGLCERCGGDRNLGECTCQEPPADPRWSGLERLFS